VPDLITDGRTKVTFASAIANQAAPTVAELNAGTSLEGIMTPDGLVGFEPDTADVDNSALNSTFDTRLPGRASFSGTMVRLKKTSATADTVYNLFVRDVTGYVVIRRGTTSSTGWATGDKVEVYPIQTGETRNLAPEANSVQRYEVPLKITGQPTIRATVA
jgi:hypothetical protein